jgi:transposase InsO family protein
MQTFPAAQLPTQDYLRTVATRLAACKHGEKSAVITAAKAFLGLKSDQALYGRLADVGFDSGRKRREDAGVVTLPRDEAEQIAALIKATTRQTGKRLMSVADCVDLLRVEGRIKAERINAATGEVIPLSTSAIVNALTSYGLHFNQLAAPAPHVQLASLHPNHCWEMDFSICVLFYLRGEQGMRMMRAADFNKNKPKNIAKIENDRVLRGVIVDHTTHTLWLNYAYGAESAETALDMLMFAMLPQEGRPYYGVPFVIYTDRGSAFNNALFTNFCRRALIEHIMHESASVKDDAARATGSVEVMNNLVERKFESRLGLGYRVQQMHELQGLAANFARWFNATQTHSRHGMTRVEAWLKITETQLRKPPAEAVLRTLAHSHPKPRTITGALTIPWEGTTYSLRDIPGLSEHLRVGDKVDVVVNPYSQGGIVIVRQTPDGKGELHFPLAAPDAADWRNYPANAPVIGESFAAIAETDAQKANKRLAAIAMGVNTADEAKAAKKAGTVAFAGLNPHANHVAPTVAYLPKRGTELATNAPEFAVPVRTLSLPEAARALRDRIGPDAWNAEHYAALARFYPEGVPDTDLDQAHDRLVGRSRLRVVAS